MATRLAEIEDTRPAGAFSAAFTAIMDSITDTAKAALRAEAAIDRWFAAVDAMEARLGELVAEAEAMAPRNEFFELDAAIERTLALERENSASLAEAMKMAPALDRMLRRNFPKLSARLHPVLSRIRPRANRHLRTLRDARWRLMAIQARHQPDETGPALGSPRDVTRYLAGLRG